MRTQMGLFKKTGFGMGGSGARALHAPSASLNLTPMIDMLTIILVFLIKSYSTTPAYLTPTQNIQLANTASDAAAPDKAVLIVGRDGILIEGKLVVAFKNGLIEGANLQDGVIPSLQKALVALAAKTKFIATKNKDVQFTGTLILQADKELPFDSLKPILKTAGLAGFSDIKFAGVYTE